MASENNDTADTLGKRLGMLLFTALFALAFGLSGYFMGLKPLVQTLWAAREVSSWQPVQAQVLGSKVVRHRDSDGTSYELQARYRYEFAGRQYEGTRVGLDPEPGADNLSDWHHLWNAQLQSALNSGQSITILVDPHSPSQALIDPAVRWALLMFHLPFALVFTGVGLGAGWVFVRTLLRLGKATGDVLEEGALPPPPLKGSTGSSAAGAWLFTVLWCGIAFPIAGVFWSGASASWYAKGFTSIFVLIGLVLVALAVYQTFLAWRYAGAALSVEPTRPRAGHPVDVVLRLPERAVSQHRGHSPQLRLAQYRVDESSSGSPERCVEFFVQPARVQREADGGLRLLARFEVPADAPPHGSRRSGERIDWRLELLHSPGDTADLSYDLPLLGAPRTFEGADELPDRFDRRAAWMQVVPITPLGEHAEQDDRLLPLPSSVTLQETPHAWHYTFSQSGWHSTAGLVLAGLAVEATINGRLSAHGLALPRSFFAAAVWWALAVLALHGATRRWTLAVQDDGIHVRARSWLWSRAQALPGRSSQALVQQLLYSTGSGARECRYYAVHARGDHGKAVRLTPGLSGNGAATAVGQSIAQAWAHRSNHFAAGIRRTARAEHSRPAWGVVLVLAILAWWL